jgi:hypothetical protein
MFRWWRRLWQSYYCSGCRRRVSRFWKKATVRLRGDAHRWPTLLCPDCVRKEALDAKVQNVEGSGSAKPVGQVDG